MPATKSSGYPRPKAEPRRGRKGSRDQAPLPGHRFRRLASLGGYERLRGRVGACKGNVGRAARPFAAARGIGLSSRFSPQSFLLSLLGGWEFWRYGGVPILLRNKRCSLAQQMMLCCATKGRWLRKAVGGAS